MQDNKSTLVQESRANEPQEAQAKPMHSRRKVKTAFYSLSAIVAGLWGYLQQPQYVSPKVTKQDYQGKYYDGAFHNPTVSDAPKVESSSMGIMYRFLFEKDKDAIPLHDIPSQKTNLHTLDKSENVIVWMGHSSYFVQLEGKRFLIDPVFSDNASPIPKTNVVFEGSNVYHADDIPEIDYLLITHDHWDHLDYPSIVALKSKIHQIITPIGVGSYFRQWGSDEQHIFEGDWYSAFKADGLKIHILPSHHFSGRMLKRNQTLWGSFGIETAQHKLYFGGDSGYASHFKEIAAKVGAFDIAVLEDGQYDKDWPDIHMAPEQTAQAAADLKAKALIPSHNSKFKLAHHTWYDPLDRITEASREHQFRLMTPMIGETVLVDNPQQEFSQWWKGEKEINAI